MAGREAKRDWLAVCQALADALGYELVEAGIEKEGAGRYLRVYIDRPGGVSLDDCEVYHRAVRPRLEHVEYDFLEISSPGLDRPLKTQRDFDKHIGETVTVKLYKAVDRQREFEGRLVGLQAGEIVIGTPEGAQRRFSQREVAVARPVVSLDGLEQYDGSEGQ